MCKSCQVCKEFVYNMHNFDHERVWGPSTKLSLKSVLTTSILCVPTCVYSSSKHVNEQDIHIHMYSKGAYQFDHLCNPINIHHVMCKALGIPTNGV